MRLILTISAVALCAAVQSVSAQQAGTFGACILEGADGAPINVGSCERKPATCNSNTCEHVFNWQADDFNTVFLSETADLFDTVTVMNGQPAGVPAALRDRDQRQCIYNEVSQAVFCFMSSAEAHLLAVDGLAAYDALVHLANGSPAQSSSGKKGSKTKDAPSDLAEFEGKYRPIPQWDCGEIGRDGGATAIQGDTVYMLESECKLTGGQSIGRHGAMIYDAQCSGEGETWSDEFILRRDEWGSLAVLRSDAVSVWESCPN